MKRKFLNRDRSNASADACSIYRVQASQRLIVDACTYCGNRSIEFNLYAFFFSSPFFFRIARSRPCPYTYFLRLLFSSSSLRGARDDHAKEEENGAVLEKVTFISQPCSFLPVFPREIPTDRYGFIRIDLSFVLIVARTRSIARFRSSAPTVGFTFAAKFVTCYVYIYTVERQTQLIAPEPL